MRDKINAPDARAPHSTKRTAAKAQPARPLLRAFRAALPAQWFRLIPKNPPAASRNRSAVQSRAGIAILDRPRQAGHRPHCGDFDSESRGSAYRQTAPADLRQGRRRNRISSRIALDHSVFAPSSVAFTTHSTGSKKPCLIVLIHHLCQKIRTLAFRYLSCITLKILLKERWSCSQRKRMA